MPTKKANGRQYPMVAVQEFDYTDTAAGAVEINLPAGAVVIGGGIAVDTAWNSGTSAAMDAGDSGSAERYAADIDLKAAGYTALEPTAFKYAANDKVLLASALVGTAATAGAGRAIVQYIVSNRAHENQPN